MKISQEKLDEFKNIVLNEANAEREKRAHEAEEKKQTLIKSMENALDDEARAEIQRQTSEIVRQKNSRVMKKHLECRQLKYSRRDELAEDLFNGVRQRLRDFAQSDKYSEYLKKVVSEAAKTLGIENVEVTLSSADRHLELDIPYAAIVYEDGDFIGGCKITQQGGKKLIDERFSVKLERLREEFFDRYDVFS